MFSAVRISLILIASCLGSPVLAQSPSPPQTVSVDLAGALADALKLDDILIIMREEGMEYGRALEDDLFPAAGGDGWRRAIERIYSIPHMRELFFPALRRELEGLPPEFAESARDFFASPLGRRVVDLENSARRAQLDEDVKAESLIEAEELRRADPERHALLQRFVEVNDLIEANVVGTLNSNAAFYFGLGEGKAFTQPLSEAEVLADVWSQEDAIREETAGWVLSYLGMAYRPLSDAELREYLAFSETPAGHALNRALFAAYDAMFLSISRDLGKSASLFIAGREL